MGNFIQGPSFRGESLNGRAVSPGGKYAGGGGGGGLMLQQRLEHMLIIYGKSKLHGR